MVSSSSKKKRGKQRKAVKQQKPADDHDLNQLVVYTPNGETYIHPDNHTLFTDQYVNARWGDNATTEILTKLTGEDIPTNGICWPNISLDQSGIVSIVLHCFLGKCEDETLGKVLTIGGDLESPSLWIKVLSKAVELEPSCVGVGKIAENIGPLIRSMCNDMTRLFFKSNTHWRESIVPFVQLVFNVIIFSTDWEVVNTLLKHEGLLASIIQWIFWDEHRPDLVSELSMEKCTDIASIAKKVIGDLLSNAEDIEDRQLLGRIGCMPIVSKDYKPHFRISYTAELMRFIKGNEMKDRESLKLLRSLLYEGDCIDKDVIMGIIDLGTNRVHDDDGNALFVAGVSSDMLQRRTDNKLCDTRVAFAIRHGLIEMCLGFIKQFNTHMSCEEDTTGNSQCLLSLFQYILKSVHDIALHQKTAKAIRSKKTVVLEKLALLEQNTDIANNPNCMKLLVIGRSIFDINGSYCCRCNKQLSKTEVKQCNGCHRMSYCSRACQKDDWLSGHKLTFNKMCTNDNIGLFQGRFQPKTLPEDERDASKLKELEINLNMIQLKLFLDHSDTILSQAKALGIPLYDCITVFDLRDYPMKIETFEYTHNKCLFSNTINMGYFESFEEREGFENSRSKENITCVYVSRMFIGVDIKVGYKPLLSMQRFFPHEWLTQKSNQISDDDKSKQIIGKQIYQKAETVNNESYTEDDNKKIRQTH